MQAINNFMDLKRVGIESTKKEKCDVCNYGMKITVVVNGQEQSRCKYCEDRKLVQELNIPATKEERNRLKMNDRTSYFMRIPESLIDAKLNDYITETDEQKRAKQSAVDYIVSFDKQQSLILSGEPGIGKTHIAVAITNALAKENSVLFLKSTNLLDLIKESYGQAQHTEQDVLQLCADVDLLVIDDLGAEYAKPGDSESWASDIIYKAIDSRLGKSLIVTTNYSESLLEQKYGFNGKRITSRMSDNAEKIRVVGKDMRRE